MKVVNLDSSQLQRMARDFSGSPAQQEAVKRFMSAMDSLDFVPAFTSHHCTEMMSHKGDTTIKSRLHFLGSRDRLAFAEGFNGPAQIGSVVDLQAFEIRQAISRPIESCLELRDLVKPFVFYEGGCSGFKQYTPNDLSAVRAEARSLFDKANRIAAIRYSPRFSDPTEKVVNILNGTIRTKSERDQIAQSMTDFFENSIRKIGDNRIDDPRAVARSFIAELGKDHPNTTNIDKSTLCKILYGGLIHLHDITPTMTSAEAEELSEFRAKIGTVVRAKFANQSEAIFSRLRPDRMPSWILMRDLFNHSQDLPERTGSELGDGYLACFALYADVSYVDRRTLENLVRVRRHSSEAAALLNETSIHKVTYDYSVILGHLRAATAPGQQSQGAAATQMASIL